MRHEDRRDAQRLDELPELHLHAAAELGIQSVEGLIQQQDPRLQHDHPRDRDALLLSARKLARIALLETGQ